MITLTEKQLDDLLMITSMGSLQLISKGTVFKIASTLPEVVRKHCFASIAAAQEVAGHPHKESYIIDIDDLKEEFPELSWKCENKDVIGMCDDITVTFVNGTESSNDGLWLCIIKKGDSTVFKDRIYVGTSW